MGQDETSIGGVDVRFHSTLWTIVLEAQDGDRDAYDHLISIYWKPAYFFVRRHGHDVETAKDLTQAFFARFMERDFLKSVSPERGKFRTFLLAALGHFLSNEYDRARTLKRGGDFNFVQAEIDLAAAEPTPEEAFRKQWALEVLARAMDRVRAEAPPEDFELLAGASPAGLGANDRKNRLHRLRLRIREALQELVQPSVAGPDEVESEIREIFGALE